MTRADLLLAASECLSAPNRFAQDHSSLDPMPGKWDGAATSGEDPGGGREDERHVGMEGGGWRRKSRTETAPGDGDSSPGRGVLIRQGGC